MRRSLFFFWLILILIPLSDCFSLPDSEKDNFYGNIKVIIEHNYEYIGQSGKTDKVLNLKIVTRYDKTGMKIDTAWYNSNGGMNSKIVYSFNRNGNLEKETLYDLGFEIIEYYTGKYDSHWRLIEYSGYRNNQSQLYRNVYRYSADNTLKEQLSYDPDDNLVYKSIYYYDRQGKQTESGFFNPRDILVYKISNDYDKTGNIIATSFYTPEAAILNKTVIRYDDLQRPVESIESNIMEKTMLSQVYSYDKKGNKTRIELYKTSIDSDKASKVLKSCSEYQYVFW